MYTRESATAALRAVLTERMEQWSTSSVREAVGLVLPLDDILPGLDLTPQTIFAILHEP
jgi:hypothetical protein